MPAPIFVGDEWTAAGFRLAGAEVLVPGNEDPERLLERVLKGNPALVLLGAEFAAQVPPEQLEQARLAARPPLLVVGDPTGRDKPEPVTRRVRHRMGVAE